MSNFSCEKYRVRSLRDLKTAFLPWLLCLDRKQCTLAKFIAKATLYHSYD